MTDWVAEIRDRIAALPGVTRMLAGTLSTEERDRLRQLAREWPPELGDPPRGMVRACLDDRHIAP